MNTLNMARKKKELTEAQIKALPDQKTIEEKLRTARIDLMIKQPFFGSMATRLELIRDDDMKTAATDGRNFFYNLEFISGLSLSETVFLFGHEVLHNAFEHHLRKEFPDSVFVKDENGSISKKCRHHTLWNIACDYAVNEILVSSNIGERIADTLYEEKYKDMCAEEIYEKLLENANKIDIDQLAEKLLDEHLEDLQKKGKCNNLSEEEKEKIREEIRENLLSSIQHSSGSIPKGIDRMVKALTSPKISWKEELRMDMQSTINYDFTFSKPNKKAMQSGYVLPGMKREESLDICIAIDSSGSISEEALTVVFSEIRGIMEQYNDYQIRVWSFDAEVHNEVIFRSDEGGDIREYVPAGGGGTLFEANWDYMKKHEINPKIFIIFTDMYPNGGWGDESYCDNVIFIGYKSNNRVAPFGKTITIDNLN